MQYIPRKLIELIANAPKDRPVLITGARNVGKETLLRHMLKEESCLWISGDDTKIPAVIRALTAEADIRQLFGPYKIIVIEEAQRIDAMELFIKKLIDLKLKCRIFITASSRLGLSSDPAAATNSRLLSYELAPLSIGELADFLGRAKLSQTFSDRLVYGSYPFILSKDPHEAEEYLVENLDAALNWEIFSSGMIRKPQEFLNLLVALAKRIGTVCTSESLARECALSYTAVENYIRLLKQSFLIKVLPSFSQNIPTELKKSKKIYFCDNGLRNAVLRDFRPFVIRSSAEQKALFENFFIIDCLKKSYLQRSSADYYFWRTKNKQELDLLEVNDQEMTAYEVSFGERRFRAPPAFRRGYPNAAVHTVSSENMWEYLL